MPHSLSTDGWDTESRTWRSMLMDDYMSYLKRKKSLFSVCKASKRYRTCDDRHNRWLTFAFGSDRGVDFQDPITSFSLSLDGRFALLSFSTQEVALFDVNREKIVKKFSGHSQKKYIIRSCFAGVGETLAMSGSEGIV